MVVKKSSAKNVKITKSTSVLHKTIKNNNARSKLSGKSTKTKHPHTLHGLTANQIAHIRSNAPGATVQNSPTVTSTSTSTSTNARSSSARNSAVTGGGSSSSSSSNYSTGGGGVSTKTSSSTSGTSSSGTSARSSSSRNSGYTISENTINNIVSNYSGSEGVSRQTSSSKNNDKTSTPLLSPMISLGNILTSKLNESKNTKVDNIAKNDDKISDVKTPLPTYTSTITPSQQALNENVKINFNSKDLTNDQYVVDLSKVFHANISNNPSTFEGVHGTELHFKDDNGNIYVRYLGNAEEKLKNSQDAGNGLAQGLARIADLDAQGLINRDIHTAYKYTGSDGFSAYYRVNEYGGITFASHAGNDTVVDLGSYNNQITPTETGTITLNQIKKSKDSKKSSGSSISDKSSSNERNYSIVTPAISENISTPIENIVKTDVELINANPIEEIKPMDLADNLFDDTPTTPSTPVESTVADDNQLNNIIGDFSNEWGGHSRMMNRNEFLNYARTNNNGALMINGNVTPYEEINKNSKLIEKYTYIPVATDEDGNTVADYANDRYLLSINTAQTNLEDLGIKQNQIQQSWSFGGDDKVYVISSNNIKRDIGSVMNKKGVNYAQPDYIMTNENQGYLDSNVIFGKRTSVKSKRFISRRKHRGEFYLSELLFAYYKKCRIRKQKKPVKRTKKVTKTTTPIKRAIKTSNSQVRRASKISDKSVKKLRGNKPKVSNAKRTLKQTSTTKSSSTIKRVTKPVTAKQTATRKITSKQTVTRKTSVPKQITTHKRVVKTSSSQPIKRVTKPTLKHTAKPASVVKRTTKKPTTIKKKQPVDKLSFFENSMRNMI